MIPLALMSQKDPFANGIPHCSSNTKDTFSSDDARILTLYFDNLWIGNLTKHLANDLLWRHGRERQLKGASEREFPTYIRSSPLG